MPGLQRLVYHSRNQLPGSDDEIAQGIAQILASSRRNNAAVEVTGALMFNSGCFAQILEGPRAAIEQTFERIQRDTRHCSVVVLEYAGIERRAFPDWSMAFVGEDEKDRARFANVGKESGFDPAHITAEMIFSTLHRLVREEEAAA
jgi:hypothetical protein